ncbi:MAG: hypothetical protein LBE57_07600 [Methanosarcinales archaeon]|jgi:hypothetical protein|nr:hypothetical protein [Methanosarcinales archaeon]
MKEEKSKLMKYGAIFAVVIMVGVIGSALAIGILDNVGGGGNSTTTHPFADIPGAHSNFTFKNAKDAVSYVPEGVLAINILRVYENDTVDQAIQRSFPGASTTRILTASYQIGGLEYVVLDSTENVSINVNGSRPHYEYYEGYNILFISPHQRVVAGNPIIIASFFNYLADNTLAKRAIDVLEGRASGATNLNDILAHADDVENYDEIIVYIANAGSNYTSYYQRSSQFLNMSSFQMNFQLESIILRPTAEMKRDVYALAENASAGVEFTVTEEGDVMKTYVDSSNYNAFMADTNALYRLISNHTNQSSSA